MNYRILFSLFCCGCAATETGNPNGTANIDSEKIKVLGSVASVDHEDITIDFEANAVTPGEGEVWVWDLSRPTPPIVTAVNPDGSLGVVLSKYSDSVFRIQARREGVVGNPFDILLDSHTVQTSSDTVCLTTTPVKLLHQKPADGLVGIVTIRNTCIVTVERERVRWRVGDTALQAIDNGPTTLEPEAQTDIEIRLDSLVSNVEDILIITMIGPEREVRAVSVIAK